MKKSTTPTPLASISGLREVIALPIAAAVYTLSTLTLIAAAAHAAVRGPKQ